MYHPIKLFVFHRKNLSPKASSHKPPGRGASPSARCHPFSHGLVSSLSVSINNQGENPPRTLKPQTNAQTNKQTNATEREIKHIVGPSFPLCVVCVRVSNADKAHINSPPTFFRPDKWVNSPRVPATATAATFGGGWMLVIINLTALPQLIAVTSSIAEIQFSYIPMKVKSHPTPSARG